MHDRPIRGLPGVWLWAGLIAFAVGCDDGTASAPDGRVADRGAADAVADATADTAPPVDLGRTDAALLDAVLDAAVDAEPDAAPPDPEVTPCTVQQSPRPEGALRVSGCRFVRAGEAAVLPRAVVVSADSLLRVAGTPLHEEGHYRDLAAAGFDVVWLLVTWDGIEPFEGTYDGAYLGRICQQAGWAAAAGLDVVLVLHQERFGPALG
ncbi:MAG: hypothetical protein KC620_19770, partial [Myxococcales bacterium]|nr:hypothetical protein [Myxococcales bacterium]